MIKKKENHRQRALRILNCLNDSDIRVLLAIFCTQKKMNLTTFQVLAGMMSFKKNDEKIFDNLKFFSNNNKNCHSVNKISIAQIAQIYNEYYNDVNAMEERIKNSRKDNNPKFKKIVLPVDVDGYLDSFFKNFK